MLYFTAEDGVQYAAYADGAVVQVRATARAGVVVRWCRYVRTWQAGGWEAAWGRG